MTRNQPLAALCAAFALLVTTACGRVPLLAPPPTPAPPATVAPAPTSAPAPTEAPAPSAAQQPYRVTGEFTYTNDIIITYYVEQAVALTDMYGFVTRDWEWEMPVDSQTLGYLKIDEEKKQGTYQLQLPERPGATFADVNHDGKKDTGVQIFAVAYWPNLTSGPFAEGDDRSKGWPNYLASVITDPENKQEVIGGNLIVWSPDSGQQFPTGFGADGLLFTDDDPIGPIPAGYSVMNLDKTPFAVSQDSVPHLTLYEPKDVAVKDFSKESYSEA
ncbi:MAG: peptidase S41, partial [Chloroflexi bacterium]|nr:peptidase S41 [Chloroflexota bacterium]